MLVIIVEVSNQNISVYKMCNSMMDLCEFVCILNEQYDIVISWTIVCVQLPHFLVTTKQCQFNCKNILQESVENKNCIM
jgi:hypothetical protein